MEKNAGESAVKLLVDYREKVDVAIKRGVRDALRRHKQAGNPIAVWRDERVVILQPEDIPIDVMDGGE